jgi:hypothetical protein
MSAREFGFEEHKQIDLIPLPHLPILHLQLKNVVLNEKNKQKGKKKNVRSPVMRGAYPF